MTYNQSEGGVNSLNATNITALETVQDNQEELV